MHTKTLFMVLLSALVFFTQAQSGDAEAVKAILSANNLTWDLNDIATMSEGRVITLTLDNKDFGGDGLKQLPADIGNLTELKKLTMNDNSLTSLPEELFNCTKLTELEIKSNGLTVLSSGIGNLTQLRSLDLRNNQLEDLPDEIRQLKSLEKLQLWGNNFVSLTPAIGELSALQELYLKGNRLTNLPTAITRLKIKYLDVLDNKLCGLSGPVDAWLKKFDKKYESLQKCLGDKRFQ